jgi:transaldolase
MTVVVADTGNIQAIEKFKTRAATTYPLLMKVAAQESQWQAILYETLLQFHNDAQAGWKDPAVISLAFDGLVVSFARKILAIVPNGCQVKTIRVNEVDRKTSLLTRGKDLFRQMRQRLGCHPPFPSDSKLEG